MIRLRRDANALATIRFVDKDVPPLGSGDFTITAKPDLTWDGGNRSYPAAVEKMRVQGPRFALPEGDVASFFPPATRGVFNESLPNIALFEPALPWERDIGGGIKRETHPWLALLLFTEDEVIGDGDPHNETHVIKRKVRDLVNPPAGTLGPASLGITGGDLDADCFTIDITQQTFAAVVPFKDDLPYLAHCRKIDVSGKITDILGDGWFSVVVANRFPPSWETKPVHIAHLVSLEGFAQYLDPARQWPPAGITNVRMASLFAWQYVCEKSNGNFNDLAVKLVRNATAGGEELRLRAPAPAGTGDAADKVKKALEQGYVPLAYDTRAGETSFAWYRGPLVPKPIASFPPSAQWPPVTSNAALIYDDKSGTFDVSYAAAWQLGRLIALSSRIYAGDMSRLRQKVKRSLNKLRERGVARKLRTGENSLELNAGALEALLEPQYELRELTEWMGDVLSPILASQPPAEQREENRLLTAAHGDPVEETNLLLGHAGVQSLLKNVAARALTDEPGSRIPEWESRLRLLRDIPFSYLVPEVRTIGADASLQMLPIDSIRFFYVDNNWVDAIVAGARSVGVDSSRGLSEQSIVAGLIHDMAHDRALEHRPKLLGNEPPPRIDDNGGPAMCGFVLRSAIVTGWEGLEIEGYRAGNPNKINLVRCDKLDDVMIALFDDRVDSVSIAEPKEVLAFGMRNNSIALRRVTGNVAEELGRKTIDAAYWRGSGVLKVSAWQDAVRQDPRLNAQPKDWGSAAFALQMIRAPLKITFYNPLLPPEGGQ